MSHNGQEHTRCPICGVVRPPWEMINGAELSEALRMMVHARQPEWPGDDICASCLLRARTAYLQMLDDDHQPEVDGGPMQQLFAEMNRHRTLGEKTADLIAGFVGSWPFLITQVVLLVLWIAFNTWALFIRHFDPYPYILLNLVLSWIAALQAPLILMSQNRQDTRDRLRDEQEFRTNVQAEEGVRQLQRKLDQLISQHWPALLEEQRAQVNLMRDLLARFPR